MKQKKLLRRIKRLEKRIKRLDAVMRWYFFDSDTSDDAGPVPAIDALKPTEADLLYR